MYIYKYNFESDFSDAHCMFYKIIGSNIQIIVHF